MRNKFLIILLLIGSVSGCSVYDSKRGEFVSSTVQNIRLGGIAGQVILLNKFTSPNHSKKVTQNNTFAIGGAFIPVSHTYIFDEVDRNNLRESIVSSFVSSGAQFTDQKNINNNSINIQFRELDMASGSFGSTLCVIVAEITSIKGTSTVMKKVQIRANGATVASAKNNAIKQLVSAVSSVASKNG